MEEKVVIWVVVGVVREEKARGALEESRSV